MLIPLANLMDKYALRGNVTGVLHIGAHIGEEAAAYQAAGITNVTWIEANPDLIPVLETAVLPYGHRVINATVSDEAGQRRKFNVTNNFMSSSLLELKTHLIVSPDVWVDHIIELETTTIDDLCEQYPITANFVNLDIQGAELLALKGGTEFLAGVDVVYAEVNEDELYEGCARVWEVDDFLAGYGLTRVETVMAGSAGWGDAVFVKSA